MAFGTLDSDDDEVMLVLLIIFIITIPVINHAVKIDLPRATNTPNEPKPQSINLTIDAGGKVFWNQAELDEPTLEAKIAQAAQQQPQPELHLRADRDVRYERVAQVMAAAQHGGLGKIGFITEPKH
jgi:biopolymer transport protein ExbD